MRNPKNRNGFIAAGILHMRSRLFILLESLIQKYIIMLIWDSTVFTTVEIKGHDTWIIVWMTTPGSTIKNKPGQPEVGVELTSPNLAKLAVLLRGILPKVFTWQVGQRTVWTNLD